MDIAGFAPICKLMMRAIAILLILAFSSFPLRAQPSLYDPKPLVDIKQLLAEERWQEIVRFIEADVERSADNNYYYGIALARLGRWDEARRAFQNGLNQQPKDKRYALELAGICFKRKNYAEAADYLRHALRLDPEDTYTNDFLASVYFLQGNLDAALDHWNRVSKPEIENVRLDPTPKLSPALLDGAFAFSPAGVLRLSDLKTTEARLDGLNIFPNYRFDLEARSDGKFDVVFRARERTGISSARRLWLLALFRGLPFQTINPEFFNIGRRAINFESLIRWDAEKRRLRTNLSGPFSKESKWRYQFDLDLRNENWDVRRSFTGPSPSLGALNLRKQAFTASVTSFVNGRWNWSAGVELSHRDYRDVTFAATLIPHFLEAGFQLKQELQFNYELVRAPQRRFTLTSSTSSQLGRIWSEPSQVFTKLQTSLQARWYPQGSGDDYEMQGRISAGKTIGQTPFDELFILGVERDNDLSLRGLRAHIGTRDGRKGSAPMGRDYFLSNWELDKSVYSNALISFKLGPFLDSGKIIDSSHGLGSQMWLWDVGAQIKIKAFGLGAAFSYGKDLRSGANAFFLSMFR